jgi:hypothetical protein
MAIIDAGFGGLFKGLLNLGSEFIEDKDKRNEFNMRVKESENEFNTVLIQTKTTPIVDAIVKLLYAFIPFFRPVGSFLMTAFGIYAHWKGLEIDVMNHGLLDSAFPLWMGSRHVEKNKK